MRAQLRTTPVRHDLRAIWLDGLAWSVMVGMGETYIPAFALGLELPLVLVGLVATVPMVAGSLLQLLAPRVVSALRSHRRVVVGCAAVQALTFVPLAIGAWSGSMSAWSLFAWASVYWAFGLGTAPAWSTWVETLVPERARIRYFARRNRALYVAQVTAVVSAGWLLHLGRGNGHVLHAFAFVFACAALARLISTYLLASQNEPAPIPEGMRTVSLRDFVARFGHGADGRLLAYMLAAQFAIQVAQPFFTPYALDGLHFSYAQYTLLLGAAVAARFTLMPFYGSLAEARGLRSLLWLGGIALPCATVLWLISPRFEVLLVAQFVTGAALGAFELATFLAWFESISIHERTSVLTTYHAANATAIFLGSMLGAAILERAGEGTTAFLWVFAASVLLRLCTLPLLSRVR